jgi:hypothetical protein
MKSPTLFKFFDTPGKGAFSDAIKKRACEKIAGPPQKQFAQN